MRSDDGLRHAGRAAAHQHDGGIVGRRGRRATEVAPYRCGVLQAILKPLIARLELDAVAALLFLEQREQHAQQRRQILLDARRDDALHRRLALNFLQALVERRQRDDDLDARRSSAAREARRRCRADSAAARWRPPSTRRARQSEIADSSAAASATRSPFRMPARDERRGETCRSGDRGLRSKASCP